MSRTFWLAWSTVWCSAAVAWGLFDAVHGLRWSAVVWLWVLLANGLSLVETWLYCNGCGTCEASKADRYAMWDDTAAGDRVIAEMRTRRCSHCGRSSTGRLL
jgi:hypothetical protein